MHTNRSRALFCAAAAAALFAGGCGDDGPALRVGTFNAGLIDGFVGYSNERVEPVASKLATVDADVLCLQEVWEQGDWDAIEAGMASTFPNTFRPDPLPGVGVGVACGDGELDPIDDCASTKCPGLEGAELVDCALSFATGCAAEFLALGDDCTACLIANINEGSVEGFRAACEVDGTGGLDVFASGGSFGTALLSKTPLEGVEHHVFEATAVRRGVIYARVTGTAVGDVHVFCTHLSADLGIVPLLNPDPEYPANNWGDENELQVADLIAYMESKATDGAPVILLGDLNTGPAIDATNVVAELPSSYALFEAGGFTSEYVEHGTGDCTFCSTNDLTGTGTEDVVIDHVVTTGLDDAGTSAKRFMTEPVDITVGDAVVTTNYSDHYGVLVTFRP